MVGLFCLCMLGFSLWLTVAEDANTSTLPSSFSHRTLTAMATLKNHLPYSALQLGVAVWVCFGQQ